MLDEIENRLNLLEFKCRRPVEHLLAGEYRSVFRGRGVEFEDVRPYQPGDDVRTMDWKVTARTGEPHIKRFVEEREQIIYLLVDLSASIAHGQSDERRQSMVELGSLLTMAAIKNQDRVGLILFTDQIEHIIPPAKGRGHAMRVMDALMNYDPSGQGTDFIQVLQRFGQMARKHSVAFLVSDFLTDGYQKELQALAYRHDINAIRLADPEIEFPDKAGLVRMRDAETEELHVVDLKAQRDAAAQLSQSIQEDMLESGVSWLNYEVGTDCVEALAGFFQARLQLALNESGG